MGRWGSGGYNHGIGTAQNITTQAAITRKKTSTFQGKGSSIYNTVKSQAVIELKTFITQH